MNAALFVLSPRSGRRWESVVAMEISPGPEHAAAEGMTWDLAGVLRKHNGTVVRKFKRQISLTEPATVFEEMHVAPGSYRLYLVLSNSDLDTPLATAVDVRVPEIPSEQVFLVGPVLGRLPDEDARGGLSGDRREIEPLLTAATVRGEPLVSLTRLCRVGNRRTSVEGTIERVLTAGDGRVVQRFDPTPVELGDAGRVRCHVLRDRLPTSGLEPGRYRLLAFYDDGEPAASNWAGFSVASGDPAFND